MRGLAGLLNNLPPPLFEKRGAKPVAVLSGAKNPACQRAGEKQTAFTPPWKRGKSKARLPRSARFCPPLSSALSHKGRGRNTVILSGAKNLWSGLLNNLPYPSLKKRGSNLSSFPGSTRPKNSVSHTVFSPAPIPYCHGVQVYCSLRRGTVKSVAQGLRAPSVTRGTGTFSSRGIIPSWT